MSEHAATGAETGHGPATQDAHGPVLTIGDLADRTGLSPATLRMWESRHGFPRPERLESGHRRYRESDVDAVAAVMRRKDAGTRLELAIAQAMADAEPAAPSVYAYLRRRHPHLGVHRLRKSTLIAMSWAIEDEFAAKADRATLWGTFQRERFFRVAEARWTELARVSAGATVFADFAETDTTTNPVQVRLPDDSPMRREWTVVCDARDLPVVLTAWELPGQSDVPDRQRLFESMWSVDGAAVHDAARVCAATARAAGVEPTIAPTEGRPAHVSADLTAVTQLFNRVLAYADTLAT